MKKSIYDKLEQLAERLMELDGLLGSENATRDMDSYRKLTRERRSEIAIGPAFPAIDIFRYTAREYHDIR